MLLSDRDVVSVGHADQVQQSGDDNVFRPIVSGGVGDGGLSPIQGAADDVEAAGAYVADEAENIEDVSAIGRVDVASP